MAAPPTRGFSTRLEHGAFLFANRVLFRGDGRKSDLFFGTRVVFTGLERVLGALYVSQWCCYSVCPSSVSVEDRTQIETAER